MQGCRCVVLAYVGKKFAQIAHMAKMCVFDAVGGIFCGQKWFLELPTICPLCPKLPTIMRDGVEHTPTNAPTNTPTSCVYGLQMPLQMGGGDALQPCRAHRIPVQGDGGCGDKPAPLGGCGQIG